MKQSMKEAIQAIRESESVFFEPAKKSGYICPICGNGSGEDGTGLNVVPKGSGHYYKCHKCGAGGDVIDFMQRKEGLSFPDTVRNMAASLGIEIETAAYTAGQPTRPAEAQEEPERDYTAQYNAWKAEARKRPEMAAYLKARGIEKDTALKYCAGYDPEKRRIIFPCSKSAYVSRAIDPEAEPRYINAGRLTAWNAAAVSGTADIVAITEGIIDALSVIQAAGIDALSINSASNAGSIAERIAKTPEAKQKYFLILGDNDAAGITAQKTILQTLTAAGILCKIESLHAYGGYKDASEALQEDPEGLRERLTRIEKTARRDLYAQMQDKAKDGIIFLQMPAGQYIADYFADDIKAFKPEARTGFQYLDTMTRGGLFPGLYVITAISGGGKTTFSLQMADQIAERGKHVLYFSLEQSRFELTSKSIARTLRKTDGNSKINALDVRQGKSPEAVREAAARYRESIGDRLTIIEGNFFTEPDYIDKYAAAYIEQRKEKPVIIIDYLQILQPDRDPETKRKPTDARQIIEENIVKLKQTARRHDITVIVISSLNRAAYYKPISFEGLKETGLIEHSADFVAGIQYADIEDRRDAERGEPIKNDARAAEIVEELSRKDTRELCFKVIKNRYGQLFRDYFCYYPQSDLFREEGQKREKATTDAKPKRI